jgi:hypothetical protein
MNGITGFESLRTLIMLAEEHNRQRLWVLDSVFGSLFGDDATGVFDIVDIGLGYDLIDGRVYFHILCQSEPCAKHDSQNYGK